MNVIETNYEEIKSQESAFLSGTEPAWLETDTTGNATVSFESRNGGRAVMNTGSGSTGDYARVQTKPLNLDQYDAVSLSITYQLTQSSLGQNDATIYQWMQNDLDNYALVDHSNGSFTVLDGGNKQGEPTQKYTIDGPLIRSKLLLDFVDGVQIHRLNNKFANKAELSNPNPSLDYNLMLSIDTEDTSADRILNLYDFEVSFYRSLRR